MDAIMALYQAKPKAISSPLDYPACKDTDEDRPRDGRSGSVPFPEDVVDDKPENSPKSMLNPDNSREQVLVKPSSHVPSLAKGSGSTSNASVAKTPVGSQTSSIRDKQLPQNGSGQHSARINSWRRESAIVNEKRHSHGPASDPAPQQDLQIEAQIATDTTVDYMKKLKEHKVKGDIERQSQSSATTARANKQSGTKSSTWSLDTAKTYMEIWYIEPTAAESAPRNEYNYTAINVPLEQVEIKRSLRRYRRWKRTNIVKQYAKLWPEERMAIDKSILQDPEISGQRNLLGIIIQKMSILRVSATWMPQRHILVFTIHSSLPDAEAAREAADRQKIADAVAQAEREAAEAAREAAAILKIADEDAGDTREAAAKQKIADDIAMAASHAAAAATKEGEYPRLRIRLEQQFHCYRVADVSILHSGNEDY